MTPDTTLAQKKGSHGVWGRLLPSLRRTLRSDRRIAVVLGLLALAKGLFWIGLMPAFKIADEPNHFENVQYRAEYHRAPHYDGSGRPIEKVMHQGAAREVLDLWHVTNVYIRGAFENGKRSIAAEEKLRDLALSPANRRGDGQITSMDYPGFYYTVCIPAYDLFRRSSLLARIAAVRILSLLFGVIAMLCTFFAARLVMQSRALAVAAAIIVALQPMESQMTIAVNNDAGVIGLGALIFYLQIRILMRAPEVPSWRMGMALGLLAGCIVMTKPQGYVMLPGCVVACGYVLIRNLPSRRAWIFCVIAAAVAGTMLAIQLHRSATIGYGVLPQSAAAVPNGVGEEGFLAFVQSLDPVYQMYLFRSAFGQFGWLEYSLNPLWFDAVGLIGTITWYGLLVAFAAAVIFAEKHYWLSLRGLLFSLGTAITVVAFILFAEYRFRTVGVSGVIQGRNFLCGLPAAAIVVAGAFGAMVPARFRTLSAAALVTSAIALQLGAVVTILRYHYGV